MPKQSGRSHAWHSIAETSIKKTPSSEGDKGSAANDDHDEDEEESQLGRLNPTRSSKYRGPITK